MNTPNGARVQSLERCIGDLIAILALPTVWHGQEPSFILGALVDALTRMLDADFAYARFGGAPDPAPVDVLRISPAAPHLVEDGSWTEALAPWLQQQGRFEHGTVMLGHARRDTRIAALRFGSLNGSLLLAGAQRSDFPNEMESLLLRVAVNQAAIGLQEVVRLSRTQNELVHATRLLSMGELTASIAHEVNQPLAAIIANGNACLRWLGHATPNLDEARASAQHIIRDANRASSIIQRIRTLSTKSAPARTPIDLNDLIREVLMLTSGELARNAIVLRTALTQSLPAVLCDRVQLQQVIMNLVMNGVEAMHPVTDRARELSIASVARALDGVEVTVRDSGIGIGAGHVSRIFEPFFTTKAQGMGLGLSISRRIIEAHGGRLWAHANPGHGLSLSFTLPRDGEVAA